MDEQDGGEASATGREPCPRAFVLVLGGECLLLGFLFFNPCVYDEIYFQMCQMWVYFLVFTYMDCVGTGRFRVRLRTFGASLLPERDRLEGVHFEEATLMDPV